MTIPKRIVAMTICFVSIQASATQFPISSGRTVEQKADSLYEMIGKELFFTAKSKDKFKAIQNILAQFRSLLHGEEEIKPEQSAYVEGYIVALQSLPASKGFKKSKCDEYQVDEKAKALLKSLCTAN